MHFALVAEVEEGMVGMEEMEVGLVILILGEVEEAVVDTGKEQMVE